MYAQLIFFDETPELLEVGIEHVLTDVVPALEESDGITGFWLVDRERGKRISVMIWDGEEVAQAAFAKIQERAALRPDAERPKPSSVERFEIYARV